MVQDQADSSKPKGPNIGAIVGWLILVLVIAGASTFLYLRMRRRRYRAFISSDNGKASIDGNGTKLKCIVKYGYSPNLPDEMELEVGDIIVFETLADDGWGDARNLSSGEEGKACTRFMEPVA